MDIEDILENPAFWILAGLGVIAGTIGFIISKKSDIPSFTTVQFIIYIVGIILIAAFWASRD